LKRRRQQTFKLLQARLRLQARTRLKQTGVTLLRASPPSNAPALRLVSKRQLWQITVTLLRRRRCPTRRLKSSPQQQERVTRMAQQRRHQRASQLQTATRQQQREQRPRHQQHQ
jgi:hypothetical protein